MQANARRLLYYLVKLVQSNKIDPNDPRTFVSYKRVLDDLQIPHSAQTYGRSLEYQGLRELAEWIHDKKLPAITGVIITKEEMVPSDGYFEAFNKENTNFAWWLAEIQKAKTFDWSDIFETLLNTTEGVKYDSWTVYTEQIATKKIDKSAIKYNGTGIPVDVRRFFDCESFRPGDKHTIKLLHQSDPYEAYIEMNQSGRTRLFWRGSDLQKVFGSLYPEFVASVLNEGKINDGPIMTFSKTDKDTYELFFSKSAQIAAILQDINIEQMEYIPVKEGRVTYYYGKRFERSLVNRERAIKIHGCKCRACGFDFEKVYGDRGKDFIEVHHNKPLHVNEGEEIEINPKTDLDPVCSNCHRMIHRKVDDIMTVKELRKIIKENADGNLRSEPYVS